MAVPSILEGKSEPVAIVGMGCRWAGGVRDPAGLWEMLRAKRHGWKEFDKPRFQAKNFYHGNQDRPGSFRTRGGYLYDDDPLLFDHSFFGIAGREVETMDPGQRKLLEVVYEAFENAGETWDSVAGTRTGVYVGNFSVDHLLMQVREWDYPKAYAATGAETSILANRISYIFNLRGPSLVTSTACSSSMYALHLAVSAIRNGDCDGAIVAAANWIGDPSIQMLFDKLGVLSPTSRCHTFDAAADGYGRGEGFVALYLKKSTLALLDGLPIRAMIRGTSLNANGKTGGITRPSARGQEEAIRKAYENAGNLSLADTTFFECHGTGTAAGDPLEVQTVGNVFASSRASDSPQDLLLIGSIKPNLGHTEGASALASIMKVVLSLEEGEIPPTYGVETLNPSIDFDAAKVLVVKDAAVPWPQGKVRRASVNSFGFGGANGHCIIDHVNEVLPGYQPPKKTRAAQNNGVPAAAMGKGGWVNGHANKHRNGMANGVANGVNSAVAPTAGLPYHAPVAFAAPAPEPAVSTASANAPSRRHVLLPFSAHTSSSLQLNIDALGQVVKDCSLADVAYTLASKRSRQRQRTFRVVDKDNVASDLAVEQRIFAAPEKAGNVAFVFTGQGAQWHHMGLQLFEHAVFRASISHLDHVLCQLLDGPSWSIYDIIVGERDSERIQSPDESQVACTAIQVALVDLLASWSIRPVAVVGHSSGEMAAAYASGNITAAEAIAAAYYRGQAVCRNSLKGAMLAVGLGAEQVQRYLTTRQQQVQIAALNSPGSVTLSGDADCIEAVSEALSNNGVFNRVLRTSGMAYHSHHMVTVGGKYLDDLNAGLEHLRKFGMVDKSRRYPFLPWISSVVPEKSMHDVNLSSEYWRENLQSPVRFTQAVAGMMSLKGGPAIDIVVEVGPHPALKGPVDQILKSLGKMVQHSPTLQRNENDCKAMLRLAGTLFALNVDIDLVAVNAMDTDGNTGTRSYIHGRTAVNLPPYQYTYGATSYYESRISREFRLRDHVRHDLLGSKVPGTSKLQPQWRNVLRIKDLPWLADHRVMSRIVFPATAYFAIGTEVAWNLHQETPNHSPVIGYTFADVDLKSALEIPDDDHGIEIIVSVHTSDNTSTLLPTWIQFTVASVARDSDEWTLHCTGWITAETTPSPVIHELNSEMDARFPDCQAWYDKFAGVGLGYGESFHTLSAIQADPHRNLAKGIIAMDRGANAEWGPTSKYVLHPTALDGALQLGIIAFHHGQPETVNTAFVPAHLSSMYLNATTPQFSAVALAQGQMEGPGSARIDLQMMAPDGSVFMRIDSMRFTKLKNAKSNESLSKKLFSNPIARLIWKPDIRVLSNDKAREMFPPPLENADSADALEVVEMICCLTVFQIYDTFVSGTGKICPKGDIRHWLAWIEKIVETDDRKQMLEARNLTSDQRAILLQELLEKAGHKPEAQAARLLHDNAAEILQEQRTGIDILVSNKLLTSLYEVGHAIAGSHAQVFNIMDALAHVNPNARILEIGAGTGAATRAALRALVGPNGSKRYASYTFTDISAGFLTHAKEMLSEYRDIRYSVLDIEKNPLDNGYEPVYDIVLACEAIHATESIDRTLANCRNLLKPGGKLVLAETTRMRVLFGLLYGTLTGYWQAEDRTEGPFMDLQTWESHLRATGFSGIDVHIDDYHPPSNTTSVLVSTRVEEKSLVDSPIHNTADCPPLYLLHAGDDVPALAAMVGKQLECRGLAYETCSLDDAVENMPLNARLIAFLTNDNDLFCPNEKRLRAFQHISRMAKSMVWLTLGNMVRGHNPHGAFMTGVLRVIAAENPDRGFISINVPGDSFDYTDDRLACSIVDKESSLQESGVSQEMFDTEFVWQDGSMWVSRVVPDASLYENTDTTNAPRILDHEISSIATSDPVFTESTLEGAHGAIKFRQPSKFSGNPPAKFIGVEVSAVAMTWSDLMKSAEQDHGSDSSFFLDYVGTVVRVGPGVTEFSVGDRVYGAGLRQVGNYERVPAAFAQKLPPTDHANEVATMPLAYMSAIYAIEHLAQVKKRQTILIQDALSSSGIAAAQIASSNGAEVFAMVTTSDNVEYLTQTLKVPTCRIFSANDPKAIIDFSRTLRKGGFDVIVGDNTSSDLLRYFIAALAPLGHFLDGNRQRAPDPRDLQATNLRINLRFSYFDLIGVLENDSGLGTKLMKRVCDLHSADMITPIRPTSFLHFSEFGQVQQDLSQAQSSQKLVLCFDNPISSARKLRDTPVGLFDSEAIYIIVGGFGGLGRSIVRWMVARGARNLAILSRGGPSTPVSQILLNDMKAQDVMIESIACDIRNEDKVKQAIAQITATGNTIKGVVHAALSVLNLSFDRLTIEQWHQGTHTKTSGLINLHQATRHKPLDFFVILTSTDTICASHSQAAHIASNNFATYFARYRCHLGLPASTVSYGFVRDFGADDPETSITMGDLYTPNSATNMTEHQALAALEPAFFNLQTPGQWVGCQQDVLAAASYLTCLDPLELASKNSTNKPHWYRDPRVAHLMQTISDARQHAADGSEHKADFNANASMSEIDRVYQDFQDGIKAGLVSRDDTVTLVIGGIAKAIGEMLFIDAGSINSSKSIAENGVDSLIAAELRNWFRLAFQVNLKNMLDSEANLKELAEQIVDDALLAK